MDSARENHSPLMHQTFHQKLALLTILSLLILMISGCQLGSLKSGEQKGGDVLPSTPTDSSSVSSETDAISKASLDRYRAGEVRDYQGQWLDPAIGPRDNSINGIQTVEIKSYKLSIEGLVIKPVELTYDEVLQLTPFERMITLHCVEGWDATILWKGVRLVDLIDQAGGAAETAKTVIFHSVDGYTTSLPWATVQKQDLILAYESNGLTLPAELGYPFIVVAENKLGYKWARWVDKIELSADENYKGFWEQRGYSNDANP